MNPDKHRQLLPLASMMGLLLMAGASPGWTGSHELVLMWGSTGTDLGQFDAPYHIALDPQGNLYVTDSENSRIQKFNSEGGLVGHWGQLGSSDGDFNIPSGITVHDGRVFVGDSDNHQVQIFDLNGNFIDRFGEFGTSDPGRFWFPIGVAVNDEGYLYVTDSWNNRVQKFRLDWYQNDLMEWKVDAVPVKTYGAAGTAPGSFDLPTGITIDHAGRVVVCDTKNHRVQILDADLEGPPIVLGREGNRSGQFTLPYAVHVGPNGDYYICDSGNDRVQVFQPDGTFVTKWGVEGTGGGEEMDLPWGIEVAPDGTVFIADANNDRIKKYRPLAVPVAPASWGRIKTLFVPHP